MLHPATGSSVIALLRCCPLCSLNPRSTVREPPLLPLEQASLCTVLPWMLRNQSQPSLGLSVRILWYKQMLILDLNSSKQCGHSQAQEGGTAQACIPTTIYSPLKIFPGLSRHWYSELCYCDSNLLDVPGLLPEPQRDPCFSQSSQDSWEGCIRREGAPLSRASADRMEMLLTLLTLDTSYSNILY